MTELSRDILTQSGYSEMGYGEGDFMGNSFPPRTRES